MPIKGLKGGIGSKALGYGLGAAEEETDAEFNQTVLLLHGDGSEGAGDTAALGDPNYKAFKDNSTSNHAIAVQGGAYGNDFSPYYYADGYWSILFDHNNDDKVVVGDTQTACGFGSSADFQIDCMIYSTRPSSDSQGFFGTQGTNTDSTGWRLQYDGSNIDWNHGTSNVHTFAFTFTPNTWFHFVIQRVSGTFKIFIDGVEKISTSDTTNYGATTNLTLGNGGNTGAGEMSGYLSNLRVITGASSTTSKITSPLSSNSDTLCLVAQSNRFVDNSSNNKTLTATNAPKISTNTPFTQSKTANVGSGFFKKSTDYLTSSNTGANFGTSDFTMECWVYYTALPGSLTSSHYIFGRNGGSNEAMFYLYNNGSILQLSFRDPDLASRIEAQVTVNTNEWVHFAAVRSGTTITLFQNGQAVTQQTTGDAGSHSYTCDEITVGGNSTDNGRHDGYIADARVVNGTAVYTSNFTPPTSSLTAVADTTFLTCQYSGAVRNVGFLDDSKYNHPITRTGNATMGTFSPFSLEDGYWSYYGGNTGGYYFADSSDLEIGTSDFTIEFWMNLDTISGGDYLTGKVPSSGAGGDTAFQIYMSGSGGVLNFWLQDTSDTTTISTPSSTISAHTWHFISCVRQSGTMRLYVDGVQQATGTRSGSVKDVAGGVGIGMTGEYADYLAGYMSNYRFVIGTCLRNDGTTFSVPTTPLTSTGSETKILTAQSNRFVDNSSTGRTPVISGTPKIQPFSPFAPTRSYSKDAVGGSLLNDTSSMVEVDGDNFPALGTGDFTIEAWVYFNDGASNTWYDTRPSGVQGAYPSVRVGSNAFRYYVNSADQITGDTKAAYAWHHVAVVRSSGSTKLYVNGTQEGSTYSDSNNYLAATDRPRFGNRSGTGFNGYLSNLRVVKGTAIYTSNFTPPTAPFLNSNSNYDDTNLLLTFNNAGIIDHTMRNNLETEGNTRISGQQTKFGTGSIYFDGTGDYIKIVDQGLFDLSGDFTIECFFYQLSTGSYRTIFSSTTTYTTSNQIRVSTGNSNDTLKVASGSTDLFDASSSFSNNQWYHMALVRSGTTLTLYLDGTSVGSATNSTSFVSDTFQIGDTQLSSTHYYFDGYIDEFRVTKGVARYTSNFTAPTKAFANK